MTDITLATTDLELITITINAVSLLGLGLAMIYAKQLEKRGARLSDKRSPALRLPMILAGFFAT